MKRNEIIKIVGFIIVIMVVLYILFPWSKKNIEGFDYVQTTSTSTPLSTPTGTIPANNLNLNNMDQQFLTLFDFLYKSTQYSDEFKRKISELKNVVESNQIVKIDDYKNMINELKKLINEDSKSQTQLGGYLLRKLTQKTHIDDLNDEISQLNRQINEAINSNTLTDYTASSTTPPVQPSKSIKCIGSGLSLNVKTITPTLIENNKKSDGTDFYSAIGPQNQERILIFLNNGCLTYDKTKSETKDRYFVKICSLTNENQIFQVNDDSNSHYKIIQPITDPTVCLAFDLKGISLETVDEGKMEHKWLTLANDIPLCNKYEAEKVSLI